MLWRLREEMPEGQRLESAQLKHDISVPVTKLHKFIDCMVPKLEKILPGIRINPFGHLGDGNIHYNLSPPIGKYDFGTSQSKLSQEVYETAEQLGGSFAAEHGLGRTKICYADNLRSKVEREYTAKIKNSFDPKKLMNPGVIFRDNK
jgi:FAD/FMN-containing dehydrogenase